MNDNILRFRKTKMKEKHRSNSANVHLLAKNGRTWGEGERTSLVQVGVYWTWTGKVEREIKHFAFHSVHDYVPSVTLFSYPQISIIFSFRPVHWFYWHPVMGTSVRQVYAPTGPLSINQCIRQYQNSVTFLFLFLTFECFNEQESNNRLIPLHNLAYGHKWKAIRLLPYIERTDWLYPYCSVFMCFVPECNIAGWL